MAKGSCGTCNNLGYSLQETGSVDYNLLETSPGDVVPPIKKCKRGCTCKRSYQNPLYSWDESGTELIYNPNPYTALYNCIPKRAQQTRDRHLNASGFMGSGVSTLKVIWWGVGALVVLAVVAKGLKVYRSAKYY